MPRIVQEYQLTIMVNHLIEMPFEAEILYFGLRSNIPTLWVLIDPSRTVMEKRRFILVDTGYAIGAYSIKNYIGTIKMLDDNVINHLFELEGI